MSDAGDGSDAEDVRRKRQLTERTKRRQESNRRSARECRRRKREQLERVMKECDTLEQENLKLRLQLRVDAEADNLFEKDQAKHVAELQNLLKGGTSDVELFPVIERFLDRFMDMGLDRASAVEFHLQQAAKLLAFDAFTSVWANVLIGGADSDSLQSSAGGTTSNFRDGFPEEGSTPKDVNDFLMGYLGITAQQAQDLRDEGASQAEMKDAMVEPLEVIGAIKRRREIVVQSLATTLQEVKKQMPPSQAAKFMVWTCHNAACMHMLNELWGKIYTRSTTGQRVNAFDVASNIHEMDEFDDDAEADGIDNNSDFELDDVDDDDDEDDMSL